MVPLRLPVEDPSMQVTLGIGIPDGRVLMPVVIVVDEVLE